MDLVVSAMEKTKLLRNIGIFSGIVIVVISLFVLAGRIFIQVYLPEPTIMQTVPSPDGKYVAYVFESNGGATTGFTYRLSILESDKKLGKGNGNTYVSGVEFDVEWMDNKVLQVNNYPTIKIYKQETLIKGIEVKYKYLK